MFFIFSTPVLIRHLWQLKTVVFLHWSLIHAVQYTYHRYLRNFAVILPEYNAANFPNVNESSTCAQSIH